MLIDVSKKIVILLLLYSAISLFPSCTSYKKMIDSAIFPDGAQFNKLGFDLAQLNQEKQKLNCSTEQIVKNINSDWAKKQAIPSVELNNLFENLKNQTQIDHSLQAATDLNSSDSVKEVGWEMLISSASFYSRVFQHNKSLRRIINRGDVAYDIPPKALINSQKFLWDRNNQKRMEENCIQLPISNATKSGFASERLHDNLFNTTYKIMGFGSELFSRFISSVHRRSFPETNINRLIPLLKKWDIICQKSPGRLTDKFIPGYFGHSGIYLGDSVFAEVIQKGAIYASPKKFLVGDEFIVIRPDTITGTQDFSMQNRLISQIGKKYDFNFNIESPDRLVCTELIYLVYDHIAWQTRKIAGRFTLPPDYLVKTVLLNDKFEIKYYASKKEIIENPERPFIEELLKNK